MTFIALGNFYVLKEEFGNVKYLGDFYRFENIDRLVDENSAIFRTASCFPLMWTLTNICLHIFIILKSSFTKDVNLVILYCFELSPINTSVMTAVHW